MRGLKKRAECGKEFEPVKGNQITCSDECRQIRFKRQQKAARAWRAKEPEERTCAECGKEFLPTHASQKLCSDECRKIRVKKQQRAAYMNGPWALTERTCPTCGHIGHGKMAIPITTPNESYAANCAMLSDKIFMELLKDSDPIEGIMRLYDESVNKREFAMALAATLLVRHRQWHIADSADNAEKVNV